jgi:glucosamine kinase
VIAGTGSILLGINEVGSNFRNYEFHHYAASAARFLSYDAVYEALAGHTDDPRIEEAILE